MTDLPNVTMVIADCKNTGEALTAIRESLNHINPARTIFFTDAIIGLAKVEVININTLRSSENYSKFIVKKLDQYIHTSHVLVIQHDGYVIDDKAWSDEFLQYDYIGATWNYKDGRNVGNGGFSLRSKKLQTILATDEFIDQYHPEDEIIGRLYRNYLISKYNIKIAPDEVAERFSYECNRPFVNTFGFHGKFWPPYREPVVVKRSASMGDVIMMEPLLRYLHEQGKRVIIDTPLDYWNLFMRHFYPIEHIACLDPREDPSQYRMINLDMTYENQPKKLVLQTYYEAAGVVNGPLVNPQLNFRNNDHTRLFHRYIVLHIDNTAMSHRNIHGVDWSKVVEAIEAHGYDVVQVGKNKNVIAGIPVQTFSEEVLAYVVSGADGFIGIDSGPSQIAVACGIQSMIFFGSVNPKFRYANFDKISVIQNECPIKKGGCYHSVVSVNGTDCEANKDLPPCITHSTEDIIGHVHEFMYDTIKL